MPGVTERVSRCDALPLEFQIKLTFISFRDGGRESATGSHCDALPL